MAKAIDSAQCQLARRPQQIWKSGNRWEDIDATPVTTQLVQHLAVNFFLCFKLKRVLLLQAAHTLISQEDWAGVILRTSVLRLLVAAFF